MEKISTTLDSLNTSTKIPKHQYETRRRSCTRKGPGMRHLQGKRRYASKLLRRLARGSLYGAVSVVQDMYNEIGKRKFRERGRML